MANYYKMRVLTAVICVAFCYSCNFSQKGKKDDRDSFYEGYAGFDFKRIPLIKPYEALKLSGSKEWIMNLHTATLQMSISSIDKITVKDSLILVYAKNTLLKGEDVSEAWFIINFKKSEELGFSNHDDFKKFLANKGVNRYELHDLDSLHESFIKKWPIMWD